MVAAQLMFMPFLAYKKFKGDRARVRGALAAIVPVGGGEGAESLEGNQAEQESWQDQLSQALAEADTLRTRAVDAEAKAAAEADALRSRAVDAEAKAAEADTLKAELAKAEGELLRLKQE